MKLIKKNSFSERGQSFVELAISLVLLLMLLMAVLDFGRAFFTWIALRDAAQEGAIYGSIAPADQTQIINRVRSSSNTPVDLTDTGAVDVQVDATVACHGNQITVTVTFNNFEIATPFMSTILGTSSFPIRARVTDTILTPPCSS